MARSTAVHGTIGAGRRRLAWTALVLYALALVAAPGLHLLSHRDDHDHVAGALRLRGLRLAELAAGPTEGHAHGHAHGAGPGHRHGPDAGAPPGHRHALPGAGAAVPSRHDGGPPSPAGHAQDSASHFALGLLPAAPPPNAPAGALLPRALPPAAPAARPPARPDAGPALARGPPRV